MELTDLKGIGPKTEKLFHQLGVYAPSDLLYYFPKAYEHYEAPVPVGGVERGSLAAVKGMLEKDASVIRLGGMPITTAYVRDVSGRLRLTWFHAPYLRQSLKGGMVLTLRGKVTEYKSGLCLNQPKIYRPEDYEAKVGTLEPIYGQTKGLSNLSIMKAVKQALAVVTPEPDFVPKELLYNRKLPEMSHALEHIHFPLNQEDFEKARRRLAYNELFLFSLALGWQRQNTEELASGYPVSPHEEVDRFVAALPYALTRGQKQALEDIRRDMASGSIMNRLVQGDVGSGKTIVALLGMMEVCLAGFQAAFMAPTEVLAVQHYEKLSKQLAESGTGLRTVLVTGSMTAKQKREAYRRIEAHEADIIIGTHALIQEKVVYDNLALVITDEQHRFGVNQRKMLGGKGNRPHVLVMSATPIPRTLAMLFYADMQVSRMEELPKDRLPIKNCVVNEGYRPKAWQFILEEVRKGRQAYVICPMVEANDMLELENVSDYALKLKKQLPQEVRIGKLHGKMRAAEKDRVMHAFLAGEIDVLVSTTVVEVGVDVPNASVILIENAERFGLAQLHQLRGRVGRSVYQSYCILMDTQDSETSRERLSILVKSNDGFHIANEDLRLRGPGDIFGIRQSGELQFSIADIYEDEALLREASEDAQYLLKTDAGLCQPEHEALRLHLEQYIEKSCTL